MNLIAVASSRTIFDSLDITETTKEDYLSRLPMFLGFVKRNGVTRDLLLDYKQYLRSRTDLGISSKNKYLAVARVTLRELHRCGAISADLSLGVKSFQQSTKHKVQGLNEEEVAKIGEYLRTAESSFKIVRLRALVALLLFQGLRQIEICRLDVEDVDLANDVIKVLGKGHDDKEPLFLHPQTAKALRMYLKQSHVKDGPLFTSLLGQKQGKRLSTRGLRSIIQGLFRELGIQRTVHGTRHFFTTRLLQEYGGDVTSVARFTRHNSLEMLMIYNDEVSLGQNTAKYVAAFEVRITS